MAGWTIERRTRVDGPDSPFIAEGEIADRVELMGGREASPLVGPHGLGRGRDDREFGGLGAGGTRARQATPG